MLNNFIYRKSCHLWDNVEKYGTARQAIDKNIMQRVRFSCRITKATNTHLEYVIVFGIPRQQWFANAPQYYVIRTLSVLFIFAVFSIAVNRPLDRWDRWFETRWGHGCSPLMPVVCNRLIRSSKNSYRVCVPVYDLETSERGGLGPICATAPKILYFGPE
jgi:hypothetical protein